MAELVNFKVYFSVNHENIEIRRFTIESDVVTNFLYLREKLLNIYPSVRGKRFTIAWKDHDDDYVTISSDEELQIALQETNSNIRKLYLNVDSGYPKDEEEMIPKDGAFHTGVLCDCCEKNVQGFRYKCMQCPDYDLCSKCEAKGVHEEHCMLRLSSPVQWNPHYGKRLAHHINRFVRKGATSASCRGEDESSRYPLKEEKIGRERCHSKRHRKLQEQRCTDVLSTFLNDWANLPQDCPMKDKPEQNAKDKPEQNPKDKPEQNAKDKPQEKKENSEMPEYQVNLMKVMENLCQFLNPLGIDVNLLLNANENGNKNSTASGSNTPGPSSTGNSQPEEEKQKADSPKEKSPAMSESSESSAEEKQEPEGWTIISNSGATNGAIPKTTTPTAPAVEEVAKSQPIYPELPKPEEKIVYHLDPKIQSAVEDMLQMGFSNEGGRLTSLLVSKDGDISRALDVLQSVQNN